MDWIGQQLGWGPPYVELIGERIHNEDPTEWLHGVWANIVLWTDQLIILNAPGTDLYMIFWKEV